VQDEISEADNMQFQGTTVKVLVESLSKKAHLNNAGGSAMPQLISRTATDYIVVFNGPESLIGNFADVRIDKTSALTLFGTFVREWPLL
jgi:tRNA-2-methylthio-N6-dimethylallyladenosine synthase